MNHVNRPRKLLLHLPSELLPVDTGAKRKFLGTLRYLKERKDFLSVDIVARNDFRQDTWTSEQQAEALKTADNFFLYRGEHDLFDFLYSRSKSFYYQKLLKQQMPVDTDYFSPPGYIKFVRSLVVKQKYDLIWIHNPDYAHLGLRSTHSVAHPVYTILDIVDLLCQLRLARKDMPPLKGLKFDYEMNLKREIQLLSQYDKLIITSQEEMALIQSQIPADKLHLIPYPLDEPDSVDRPPSYSDREFNYDLLFVGAPYYPNVEGINFFLSSVFPEITAKKPNVKLAIAGKVCGAIQIDPAFKQNVECLGFVESLSELYSQSSVVICPLLHGSGTKIKLQEAMAYAIPIVATTTGASGLSLKNGFNSFITDDPATYAQNILELLKNPELAQKISEEVANTFESEYSKSAIYSKLDAMLGIKIE
jgi:glycosyltransferase involved in cell wall biosynthesis